MVFPSVPLYLDPPNWQQHPNQQQQQQQQLQGNGTQNDQINHHHHQQHLIPPPRLPPTPPHHPAGFVDGGGGQTSRPSSMAERARQAKIPPPEAPLKCPRCDSTNTKFCYFNNYSLLQPRHFCKTCRRYWTRGGALRNVPVGGGCRRNKRSSSSKSSSSSAATTTAGATSSKPSSSSLSSAVSLGPALGGLPSGGSFMASLQNIAQLGMGNLGLSFGGSALHSSPLDQLDHYGSTTTNINNLLNHQLPSGFPNFLGGFEVPGSSNSSFQNIVGGGEEHDQVGKGTSMTNMSGIMGSASVKMEDNGQGGGLSIEKGLLMGISTSDQMNVTSNPTNNGQFWGATTAGNNVNNMWSSHNSHLSGLNSSSTATTSHLL